jgi:DNA invertase Pin-like site-specific DNA recombinase
MWHGLRVLSSAVDSSAHSPITPPTTPAASSQARDRDGFQHLVTEVALGHAGIVLGLEVSRLARNNADWHRLLELAAMSRTLILDEDGVYDPASFNDRLLLGLKGTMSEAELHILKSRLQGGILNKARRGELEMPLPVGLVYDGASRVVLDPDRQVRDSVAMLFEVFRDLGSASAVIRRLRAQEVMFPRRIRRGIGKGDLLWGALDVSRALQILHNPRYAGAFAYGRSRIAFNAQLRPVQRQFKQPDWPVLIRDAHEGYIDWPEFERNQHKLRQNLGFSAGERGSMPREGSALLQGRLLCGKCGSRMRVHYEKLSGQLRPYYRCTQEIVRRAGKPCQWVHGLAVDEAIGALQLQTVAPAAIEVALAVQEEIAQPGKTAWPPTVGLGSSVSVRWPTRCTRRWSRGCAPAPWPCPMPPARPGAPASWRCPNCRSGPPPRCSSPRSSTYSRWSSRRLAETGARRAAPIIRAACAVHAACGPCCYESASYLRPVRCPQGRHHRRIPRAAAGVPGLRWPRGLCRPGGHRQVP